MAQTTITTNPAVGQAGSLASTLDGCEIITKVAAEAIVPGCFVVLTADDETTCELPDATGEAAGPRGLGVALHDPNRTTANYAVGDMVQILTRGEIWVSTEDAVTAGNTAFVRFADAATTLGTFRSDADTADADDVIGATYTKGNGAAGLAVVKLNGQFQS